LGLKKRAKPAPSPQPEPPGLAPRRVAAALLQKVLLGGVPLDALVDEAHGHPAFRALEPRDRALTRAILGAALRHRGEIEAAIGRRLERPLEAGAHPLSAILQVGAAQILFLDVPDHAAVSLAVSAADADRRTRKARGLVNSVLRRIARERAAILAVPHAPLDNTPAWLMARWQAVYGPEVAAALAEAHRDKPPLDLSAKSDPHKVAAAVGGIVLPTGTVRLADYGRVSALPGYDAGEWWVQDAAAALPARLLGPVDGTRVADLCAAPGGKSAQLAAAGAQVTAVDQSPARMARLAANMRRLRLEVRLVTADVMEWQPDEPFDAVLLDAPCSATGTIRRHPDVPWLKRPDDIAALAELQRRMLARASGFVAPGGRLVYCSCSLEPEEGERQAEAFLADNPGFELEPVAAEEVGGLKQAVTLEGYLRTLPSFGWGPEELAQGMDGFFVARFRRRN
jgi:16S rRNA (cytosine967-C5)-methyltransferase